MPNIRAGKMYYYSFTSDLIKVDEVYNSSQYGDPEMRWYVRGTVLRFYSGRIETVVDSSIVHVNSEVDRKGLLQLRKLAVNMKLSVEALKFLGIKKVPEYAKKFHKGEAYRLKKNNDVIVIVKESNFPQLKCLEVRLAPFRMYDSEHSTAELNPTPVSKSFLESIAKRAAVSVTEEILGA